MDEFWEKVEHANAKLIPVAIAALLFVIVVELSFQDFAETYQTLFAIIDGFIIAIFVVDLIFLGMKAKNTKFFFKNYWLDIIAIFPFGIMFNVVTRLYRTVAAAQKSFTTLARSGRAARGIRVAARSIRVVTKSKLFTEFEKTHRKAKHNRKHGKNTRRAEIVQAKKMRAKQRAAKKRKKARLKAKVAST